MFVYLFHVNGRLLKNNLYVMAQRKWILSIQNKFQWHLMMWTDRIIDLNETETYPRVNVLPQDLKNMILIILTYYLLKI